MFRLTGRRYRAGINDFGGTTRYIFLKSQVVKVLLKPLRCFGLSFRDIIV
jgi:hypothetical protein